MNPQRLSNVHTPSQICPPQQPTTDGAASLQFQRVAHTREASIKNIPVIGQDNGSAEIEAELNKYVGKLLTIQKSKECLSYLKCGAFARPQYELSITVTPPDDTGNPVQVIPPPDPSKNRVDLKPYQKTAISSLKHLRDGTSKSVARGAEYYDNKIKNLNKKYCGTEDLCFDNESWNTDFKRIYQDLNKPLIHTNKKGYKVTVTELTPKPMTWSDFCNETLRVEKKLNKYLPQWLSCQRAEDATAYLKHPCEIKETFRQMDITVTLSSGHTIKLVPRDESMTSQEREPYRKFAESLVNPGWWDQDLSKTYGKKIKDLHKAYCGTEDLTRDNEEWNNLINGKFANLNQQISIEKKGVKVTITTTEPVSRHLPENQAQNPQEATGNAGMAPENAALPAPIPMNWDDFCMHRYPRDLGLGLQPDWTTYAALPEGHSLNPYTDGAETNPENPAHPDHYLNHTQVMRRIQEEGQRIAQSQATYRGIQQEMQYFYSN